MASNLELHFIPFYSIFRIPKHLRNIYPFSSVFGVMELRKREFSTPVIVFKMA